MRVSLLVEARRSLVAATPHAYRRILPFLLTVCLAGAAGAQQGTITGRVTSRDDGDPLALVQVSIVGRTIGAVTNEDGRYTIRNAPAGTHTVRAIRVGRSELKKSVTINGGETATVDFALNSVPLSLAAVMTTATGPQRREEIGNAVTQINADEVVASSPIRSVDDLLNSRAPGVVIQTGTQTGTGSRVRIRGQSSLSLGNDPIYIIDGIRMTSDIGSNRYGTGGSNASRVGDINPEEIQNIEVVKGPSAATLYGTDAANGVILITTKRGRAGAARWTVYSEAGMLKDQNDYPMNYTIAGHSPGLTAYRECALPLVSAGSCIRDSVRSYAPLHDPDATPLGTGSRYQTGVQVSGGTEVVRYFLSAEREDETGIFELPAFERRRFDSTGVDINPWTERPNKLGKNSMRMNLSASVNPKLDLSMNTAFINLEQRFTLESNATAGLGSHLYGGPGYKANCLVAVTPATPCNGYRAWTPGYTWQEKVDQRVNRFIVGLDADWRPASWNVTRITVGNDLSDRVDNDFRYLGQGPPLTATYRDGFKGEGRTDIRNLTANAASSGSFNPRTWLNSKTTVGVQFVNYQFETAAAEGTQLPPGAQTAGSGSIQTAVEATTVQKTLGAFIEEGLSFNDRLYVTLAVRSDQNSAFGTNFQRVVYPKASLAWVISEESFFPRPDWINLLRLRTAYGASGVQPGPNDALVSFDAARTNIRDADVPVIRNDRIGNADLKPERTAELEGGFEVSMLGNRLSLDFTGYRKRTQDALINAIVPPSAGTGVTTLRTNLGAVQNMGVEMLLNMQIIDRPQFGWQMTVNGSKNSNKLISLGGTPPQITVERRVVEGYPLFGWWARAITGWQDKNGDKILTYNADPNLNEVFVADSATFRGYTQPRNVITISNGVDFLSRRALRLSAVLDYRGGNLSYNNTERIRCVSRQNCNGLMNPESSFEEQAMVVATRDHPSRTLDGFFQPGAFTKLREVSMRYSLPPSFATMMKARSADLVLTGRNLAKWTKYRGVDPENDYTVTDGGDTPSDFQTVGPASYYTFRVSLGF